MVAPVVSAAFLASLAEVVEAFTIVLAATSLRGWRPAAIETTAGLTVLAGIVLLVGPLLSRIPVFSLQLAIEILLLLLWDGLAEKGLIAGGGCHPFAR